MDGKLNKAITRHPTGKKGKTNGKPDLSDLKKEAERQAEMQNK